MSSAAFDEVAEGWVVTWALPLLICVLFSLAAVTSLRYLPAMGRVDHTQGDFLLRILAPVFAGAVCFTVYNSYRDVTLEFLLLWMLIPCVAGWAGYLVFCGRSWKERLTFLLGPMTLAVFTMGAFIGAATFLVQQMFAAASWALWVTLGPPVLLLGTNLALSVFAGLTSRVLADEDREWLARASAWLLLACCLWTGVCGLVLLAPAWAFRTAGSGAAIKAALAGVTGATGWLSAFSGLAADPGGSGGKVAQSAKKAVIKASPAVFAAALAVGLAMGTNWLLVKAGAVTDAGQPVPWWDHKHLVENTPWYAVLAAAALFAGFAWVTAWFVNINRFSLQGMYRNRLIRAYLGASNPARASNSRPGNSEAGGPAPRPPNSFTGFTESDNVAMHELRGQRPLHVVNTALNLVAGRRLAWQQRKAESFTIGPFHCGSRELGYRPASEYGGPGGITLGTAVSISGAAASPNMGYHSSPAIGFLLTLFNARLGAWLGNPGRAGERCWKLAGPRSAVDSLVKEAFGLTTDASRYVYLSDGGHFENLALYEMVLRRCRMIVVLDGGCDPNFTFEDLGNAVRKIRIDFGIPIEFPPDWAGKLRLRRCVVAEIRYPDGPAGRLLYIKPLVSGTEPPDVATYHTSHSDFPHESTAQQWFDEAQTESYRMLGLHTIREICDGFTDSGLERLCEYVQR